MSPQRSNDLIPGLPNEMAQEVLYHSSIVDLIKWQRVAWKWNDFINNDQKIGNMLFRFPMRFCYLPCNDTREERKERRYNRKQYIANLWTDLTNKHIATTDNKNFWNEILINPVLLSHATSVKPGLGYVEEEQCLDISFSPDLWLGPHPASWKKMWITFPPMGWMICTVLCEWYNDTGLTLKDAFVDNDDDEGVDDQLLCILVFPEINEEDKDHWPLRWLHW
jgi:hypothetical protein